MHIHATWLCGMKLTSAYNQYRRCFIEDVSCTKRWLIFLSSSIFCIIFARCFFIKQDVMHTEKQQAAAASGSQRSGRAKDMRMAVNVNSTLKCQGNVVR